MIFFGCLIIYLEEREREREIWLGVFWRVEERVIYKY